jgi:predicted Zn finger-like uncharacterized protein
MVSALPSTVVIECPHCGTRYQLPPEAIGPKGRQVACAHCGQTWQAKAIDQPGSSNSDDALFDRDAEAALDDEFANEERASSRDFVPAAVVPVPPDGTDDGRMRTIAEIKAAIAPRAKPEAEDKPDPKAESKRQRAFAARQAAFSRSLPVAKLRRGARVAGVLLLAGLLVGGVAFRTEIVRQFPDLAGVYESLGLGVNVVGLEFRDVTTLVALRGGNNVMQIDARIYSVAARRATVPPVVVTLLDGEGERLYEWSVVPEARELAPGEVVDFSTQLSSPPPAVRQVRLTFNDGKGKTESPISTAAAAHE